MYKRILYALLFLLCPTGRSLPVQATQRALLIGISEYSTLHNSDWNDINGANDILLIEKVLQLKKVKTTKLVNNEATASNIRKEINKLIANINENDTIYLHFSGHGQPVEDLEGDEPDEWDESIVPVDARMWYKQGVYEGKNHITDDELNLFFGRIRKKIGARGMLFVVIDACHSGTMFRNEDESPLDDDAPARGTYIGFAKDKPYHPIRENEISHHYDIQADKNLSPVVIIEACQAWQQNIEIQIDGTYYGPLSYAIYTQLSSHSFDDIIHNPNTIDESMQQFLPQWRKQHIVVETSIK